MAKSKYFTLALPSKLRFDLGLKSFFLDLINYLPKSIFIKIDINNLLSFETQFRTYDYFGNNVSCRDFHLYHSKSLIFIF